MAQQVSACQIMRKWKRTTKGGQGISWIHSWRIKHCTGSVLAQMEIQSSRSSVAVVTGMAFVAFYDNNRFLAVVNGWVYSASQSMEPWRKMNGDKQYKRLNRVQGIPHKMENKLKKFEIVFICNFNHLLTNNPSSTSVIKCTLHKKHLIMSRLIGSFNLLKRANDRPGFHLTLHWHWVLL